MDDLTEMFPEWVTDMMLDSKYFMGYFWWHYKYNGSLILTWWKFYGGQIKRSFVKVFFYSVGYAVGWMLARKFLIPDYMLEFYTFDKFVEKGAN